MVNDIEIRYTEIIPNLYGLPKGFRWRADFGSPVPGSPPCGYGRSKEEALGGLLTRAQRDSDESDTPTDWSKYLGFDLVFIEGTD
jgi:hypothetical protein